MLQQSLFEVKEAKKIKAFNPTKDLKRRYSIGYNGGLDTLAVYPKMSQDKYRQVGALGSWLISDDDERKAFLEGWEKAWEVSSTDLEVSIDVSAKCG